MLRRQTRQRELYKKTVAFMNGQQLFAASSSENINRFNQFIPSKWNSLSWYVGHYISRNFWFRIVEIEFVWPSFVLDRRNKSERITIDADNCIKWHFHLFQSVVCALVKELCVRRLRHTRHKTYIFSHLLLKRSFWRRRQWIGCFCCFLISSRVKWISATTFNWTTRL